jgi:ATP-dependent helicase/nuclease subunit B
MTEIAKKHHVLQAWASVMAQIRAEIERRQVHPARTVVLLPYAQLMAQARQAWLICHGGDAPSALFLPRFETTMNWCRSLGGVEPGALALRMDPANDLLTAASLLAKVGLGGDHAVLAGRLMEAATSLARQAAAVPPAERQAWGAALAAPLLTGLEASVFEQEAALARLALLWASSASYPTDPVFDAQPELLIVLEGFQTEPMAEALRQRWGDRLYVSSLAIRCEPGAVALHAAKDAEDEAHRAAACVISHLVAGRNPVALVAQDRLLTRRVRAMLAERGVAVRDETGWKLSTTRAAASLMSLLRASAWDASTDSVLDWLKHANAFDALAVTALEASVRRLGVRDWRSVPDQPLVSQVTTLLDGLRSGRPLVRWLTELRLSLQTTGQWQVLQQDPAGLAVLNALRLGEGAEQEFAEVPVRMSASEFTTWVSQTLEGHIFSPAHPARSVPDQVVILPLSQLLGRPMAAVVFPGCDEVRLPVSAEPPGLWTPAQRELLGLPTRAQLLEANRASWHYALQFPHLDILWRSSEGGEALMASGLVQQWQLLNAPELAPDPSVWRTLSPTPGRMPGPQGDALTITRLSSTAYEDLRRCPYRFFALRQLKLQAADELDAELDKRDFGNWLHSLLKLFHEALQAQPEPDSVGRLALINTAAEAATQDLGLSPSEFLPFAAAWPRVRNGYLAWLAEHEATGAVFKRAESWQEMPLGALTLVGKIDRIDRQADGSTLVMDYKTEPRATTAARLKDPLEDTQLAFYAALLTDDTLAAAYVNVGEKEATRSYVQADIVDLRDQLIDSISSDMARIAQGAAMPAMGEGKACDFCAARGLCRKDFWDAA